MRGGSSKELEPHNVSSETLQRKLQNGLLGPLSGFWKEGTVVLESAWPEPWREKGYPCCYLKWN